MEKVLEVEKNTYEFIKKYQELDLGKPVCTPYFINSTFKKDLRAMVGKGLPEEIEMEARIWAKIKNINFENFPPKEIQEFLISLNIGIDCSGFVIHILNNFYKSKTNKNIFGKFVFKEKNLLQKISFMLKPVENLSVEQICNQSNSYEVDLNKVRPYDVIRSSWKKINSNHIMLVTKVARDEKNNVKYIEYVHSRSKRTENEDSGGIHFSRIQINDVNLGLEKATWLEVDSNGVSHTLEGFLLNKEENGIKRLKVLDKFLN